MSEKESRELNENQRNHNFVMMYRDHMPEVRWLMKKSGIASSMLNFIMEHMDNNNALCCSYQVFIDYFDISKDTVRRCIKLLKDNGFIDVLKSGTSNVYIVNEDVAWTSYGDEKKFCKFKGNILVSATENKDYYYRSQFDRFKELRERENIK
ncbi:MAG: replication/maintenance protein RepL [Niameybacter sp.]